MTIDTLRTLVHEIQHRIQDDEGFSTGGRFVDMPEVSAYVKGLVKPIYEKMKASPEWQELEILLSKTGLTEQDESRIEEIESSDEIVGIRAAIDAIRKKHRNIIQGNVFLDVLGSIHEMDDPIWEKLEKQNPDFQYELYKHLAGEVESKVVELRLENPEYRKELIVETESKVVPRDEQVLVEEAFEISKEFASESKELNQTAWTGSPNVFDDKAIKNLEYYQDQNQGQRRAAWSCSFL